MGELIGGEKVSVLACQDCVNHDVLQCPPFHMFNHDSQLVHVEEWWEPPGVNMMTEEMWQRWTSTCQLAARLWWSPTTVVYQHHRTEGIVLPGMAHSTTSHSVALIIHPHALTGYHDWTCEMEDTISWFTQSWHARTLTFSPSPISSPIMHSTFPTDFHIFLCPGNDMGIEPPTLWFYVIHSCHCNWDLRKCC